MQNEWQRQAILLRAGDTVVAVSHAPTCARCAAAASPPESSASCRNGTLGSPRLRSEAGAVELAHPASTTVAGLYERKGIPELVTASRTYRCPPPAHLYLVGYGPYRPELQARLASSPAGDRVHVEGFRSDALSYLRATDVFVLASRRAPCPLVLSEARQAGCAIVGTDVDGIPEALEGGRAGLLVAPGDVAVLEAALRRLLGDDRERRRLAEAPRENLDWLSAEHMADEMGAVYERPLGGRLASA